MHVRIDSGYVLDQPVARTRKMSKASFQIRQKFGKGQSVLVLLPVS